MIKIGIYDRYLSTLGGGERYSCKIAEILSEQKDYSVDLITDIYEDLGKISERLNLDLSRLNLKVFPFLSEEYAGNIAASYNIFINATYLSSLSGHGQKNLYLCYFPTRFDVDFKLIHKFLLLFFCLPARWLFRFADKLCGGFKEIKIEEGLYEPKKFFLRRGSWSSGSVVLCAGRLNKNLRIGLKNPERSGLQLMNVSVRVLEGMQEISNTRVLYRQDVTLKKNEKKVVEFPESFSKKGCSVVICSNTFIPAEVSSSLEDSRRLGVFVYDESRTGFIKMIVLKMLGFVPMFLVTYPRNLKFLETYDEIISISKYSKSWIRKLWKKDSILLFPPVDTGSFKVGKKEKIILSVGRFFPEHHNKKQLELAETFIDLYDNCPEVMNGYALYLIGGVEQRKKHLEYVNKIKNISKNYPVKIITNIEWRELVEIFSKAFIFWHGAGMGEDEKKHPEKFEHFGITTVEAMASGCIPIVIGRGGQKEIVRDGEDGFLYERWDELKDITLKVCRGDIDVEAVRKRAIESCKKFSSSNFEKKLLSIISNIDGECS